MYIYIYGLGQAWHNVTHTHTHIPKKIELRTTPEELWVCYWRFLCPVAEKNAILFGMCSELILAKQWNHKHIVVGATTRHKQQVQYDHGLDASFKHWKASFKTLPLNRWIPSLKRKSEFTPEIGRDPRPQKETRKYSNCPSIFRGELAVNFRESTYPRFALPGINC